MKKFSVTIRFRDLDNNKQSIYLDIYDGKSRKRKRQFLAYHIYKDPQTRLQRQENRLYLNAAEEARVQLLTERVLPKEVYFFTYWDSLVRNKTGKTRGHYDVIREQLLAILPKTILLNEITRETLEDYIEFLNDKYTGSSPWLHWTKLKYVFNSAIKDEIIRSSPCDKVDNAPKRIDTEVDSLTIAEMRALNNTDCIDPEFKRAFLFSCFCGFRLWSEVLKITWEDVEDKDGATFVTYTLAKSNQKRRTVRLNKQAVSFLGERREGECFQLLFHQSHESTIVLPKWVSDAGIKKKITSKAGRHTFATHVQNLGGDIYLTQEAIGHAELKNTQVYAKTAEERIKKVLDDYSL